MQPSRNVRRAYGVRFSTLPFEMRFLLGNLIGNFGKSHVVMHGSFCMLKWRINICAELAQLAEQLICNQ